MKLQPFENESQALSIGGLNVENRVDQLELYGSLSLTRDQSGLAMALQLKELIDAAVAHLQQVQDLPEHLSLTPTDPIDNPFK
jgi:hypothetical protein